MIAAAQVVAAARGWLGVPWRHQGRDRYGLDCAGLLLAVADDLRLPRPRELASTPMPDLCLFDLLLPEYCYPVSAPEPGAVLRLTVKGRAQHLGICSDHPHGRGLIHAYMTRGAVCEHRLDEKWARRLVSAWRIKGVA